MRINEIISEKHLNNPYGVIVPFSVTGAAEGDFSYDVYDVLLPILRSELSARIDDYLTEGFYRRINLLLSHAVSKLGYAPDFDLTHSFLLQYRATAPCGRELLLPSTAMIENLGAYTDLTDTEFDTDEFPVFATLQGDRLISVCGVNGFLEENTVEIAVETIDSGRGNGYARSNVCSMVSYLVGQGYTVAYQCYPENAPSIALAKSCGLPLYSRDYHFVCYEKEL